MTTGITLPAGTPVEPGSNIVDELVEQVRAAAEAGLGSVWFSQAFQHDAITVAALTARAVPGIRVGTSVVPIYPRHPLLVSSQAQTAQAASGGRFTLGLGLSAKAFAEGAFGAPWHQPAKHLREYLQALNPLLHEGSVDFTGETLTARSLIPAGVPGAQPPVPVVVAAMGPQALRVTGELADGTLPFLASPGVIADYIVPTITKAAEAAGRPAPRIIAAFPGVVTADVDEVRARAQQQMTFYNTVPSYRAVLDRGGVEHPADLAVIGDEETVAAAVRRYRDAGATEVVVTQTGIGSTRDRARTWAVVGELNRG